MGANVDIDKGYLGQRLLKRGFRDWFLYMFNVTNGTKFIVSPIHELLFEQINRIIAGEDTRVNINLCPRSGKTTLAIWLTIYALTVNPKSQIIYTSYSQDLLSQVAKQIGGVLSSPIYNAMYGMEVATEDKEEGPVNDFWREYLLRTTGKPVFSTKKIMTSHGGIVLFSAIGGQITGFGSGVRGAKGFSGLLIIDDANKASDRRSDRMMENVQEYFVDTLLTRLNNSDTPIANIQQRVHLKDLSGFLAKNYGFKRFKFPLEDEETGECNLPHQYTPERIAELKINMANFMAQYQQEPMIEGGNLFKQEMFIRGPMPSEYAYTFITCDTASTSKTTSDYTVAGFWGVWVNGDERRLYLLDLLRDKIDSAKCEDYLVPFIKKHAHENFVGSLIEPKGHGIYLNQKMPMFGVPMQPPDNVDEFFKDRKYDKVARANIIIPHLVNNTIICGPDVNDKLFEDCKSELMAFPDGTHDDFCLSGDTLISTLNGDKPIKDIVKGDKLITPLGISEVTECCITGIKKTINKFGLKATPEHKVFVGNMFDKLSKIMYDVFIDKLTYKGLIKWQYKKLLYLMEKNTVLWGRESIISINAQQIKDESVLKDFILRCGSIIAERKFRKVMLFIIKMVTCLTTTTVIWSVYQGKNTLRYTQKTLVNVLKPRKLLDILLKFVNLQKNGTQVKKVENGTAKRLRELWNSKDKSLSAPIVEDNLKSVLPIKQISTEKNSASYAMINTISEKDVQEKEPVYNITTKAGCYYANGILVSNCDVLIDAVKFTYNREVSILDVL